MTIDTAHGSIDHAIGPDGLFVLRLGGGDAVLRGVDGDRVTVRSDDGELTSLEVEPGEGSLAIRGRQRDGDGTTGSCDLAIDLPAGATVVIEAGSADIVAEGLVGDIRVTTTSGDLSIRDAAGSLTAEAVSGDIEIAAPGALAVTARTVSGDLDVRAGTIDRLTATTTSGDLTIVGRFAGDGPFMLETVSGDAILEPIGDARIEFTTLTGDVLGRGIEDRSSADGRQIVVGSGGGPTIVFRSTSGDLAINPRPMSEPVVSAPATAVAAGPEPRPTPGPDPDIEVLRALERGEIDIDEASRRLETLDADLTETGDA